MKFTATLFRQMAPPLLMLLFSAQYAFAQTTNSPKRVLNFSNTVSVTNNGFSFIPSFTLGKPAAIFNLSLGGKRFSFDPELRFALEGKPWSFIFIWRYKLLNTSKFQLTIGTHLPALSFKTVSVEKNGETLDVIQTQRFLPFELTPTYSFSKNISVGMFYLYALGLEKDVAKNTNFISLRSNFSNIKLSKKLRMRLNPQLYFLKADDKDGFYFASGLNLSKTNFPFSLGAMVNKAIRSSIPTKDFNWNVSLVYTIKKQYSRA